jgi:hypothetical protein
VLGAVHWKGKLYLEQYTGRVTRTVAVLGKGKKYFEQYIGKITSS